MAGIDSILRIVAQNAADELRLGTDEAPRMFRRGAPLKLSIPVTSELTLRHLLGPLLDEAGEAEPGRGGTIERPPLLARAAFRMTLVRRAGGRGFDVVFARGGEPARAEARIAPARAIEEPPAPPTTGTRSAAPQPALSSLLERAVAMRASDLHLAAGEPPS